jgi:hypothetical protein
VLTGGVDGAVGVGVSVGVAVRVGSSVGRALGVVALPGDDSTEVARTATPPTTTRAATIAPAITAFLRVKNLCTDVPP